MSTFRRPFRQFLVTSLVFGMVTTSGWGLAPVLADDPSAGGQTLEAPQPSGDDDDAPDSVDALSQDMTLAPMVLAAAAPEWPRSTENAAREDTDSRYAQAQGGQFGFAALCGGLLTPCGLATPTTGWFPEWIIFLTNAVTVGNVLAPWTTSPPCPTPPGPPCICPPGQTPPWPPLAGPTAMAFLGALCGPAGFAGNIGPGPGSFTDIDDAQCRDRLFAAPELGGAKANINTAAGTRAAQLSTVAGGARIVETALCAAANAANNISLDPLFPTIPPPLQAAVLAWAAIGPPFSDGFDTLYVASGCGIPLKLQGEMYRCGYENIIKGFIEGFFCGLAVCAPLPFGIPCFITIVSSSAAQDSGEGLPEGLDTVGPNCGDGNCVPPENCCNCPDDCGDCMGPCCVANSTPGCDDGGSPGSPFCCELVCAVDPDCCDIEWTANCVVLANTVCEECNPDFADLPELGDLDDPAFAGQLLSLFGELTDLLAAFPNGPLFHPAVMAMDTYTCNSTSDPSMVHIKARVLFDAAFNENGISVFDLEDVVLDSLALNGISASTAAIRHGVFVINIGTGNDGIVPGPCPLTAIVSGSTNGGTILVASDPAGNPHFASPMNDAKKIMRDLGFMEIPSSVPRVIFQNSGTEGQ